PRGGEGLFVLGPYSGQLSARGEVLRVRDTASNVVHTFTYEGAPSAAQQFLRIAEMMYHPAADSGEENAAEVYEYIRLKNISPDTEIAVTGVRFIDGITFDFTT